MRRVVWSDAALDQLEAIWAYIGQFSPAAAQKTVERIVVAGDSLDLFAERGRPVRPNVRELLAASPI